MSLRANRNFRILLSGQLLSTVGNNLFAIALPWYVYVRTGSKAALVLTGLAQTLPAVVGLFSGVLVDRWPKRATMIGSDGIRAALSLILVFAVLTHGPLLSILVVVLALEMAGQFFFPASMALFPLLVRPDEVAAGSGLMQSTTAGARLIGAVSGGALMSALGAPWLFVMNGVSFIVSVISLLSIRIPVPVAAPTTEPAAPTAPPRFFREWRDGLWLIARSRLLLLLVVASLVVGAAMAPFDVALTAWVKGPMHGSAFDLGVINAGLFVGMMAGGVLMGRIAARVGVRSLLTGGLIGTGLAVGTVGLFPQVVFAIVLALISGFFLGVMNSAARATLIPLVAETMRGRVFGTLGALSNLAMPLGMTIGGVGIVRLSLPLVFALIGAGCAISAIPLLLPTRKDLQLLEHRPTL